jgi:hypothetical protein
MHPRLYIVATFAALLIVATGCDSSTVGPPLTVDTTVVSKANLRADSTIGWLYYSIDADSVVSPSLANTAEWDIRMAYLNSGNAGVGSVRGGVVKSRFEQVAQLPADVALRSDDTLNPVVSFIGASGVWIYAGAPNHTLSPSPDRCIVIETSKGRRVKFQFTSIYEGSPVTPTQNSPIGFYHFRYANLR